MTNSILCEALLPSGRAVQFHRLDTERLLSMIQRVSAAVGDAPDPGQARMKVETMKDTVASCLKAITLRPVALVHQKDKAGADLAEIDVDATLKAIPEGAYTKLSHQDLVTSGELSMFKLLADPTDWNAVQSYIGGTSRLGAANPFAGKVRMRSAA